MKINSYKNAIPFGALKVQVSETGPEGPYYDDIIETISKCGLQKVDVDSKSILHEQSDVISKLNDIQFAIAHKPRRLGERYPFDAPENYIILAKRSTEDRIYDALSEITGVERLDITG